MPCRPTGEDRALRHLGEGALESWLERLRTDARCQLQSAANLRLGDGELLWLVGRQRGASALMAGVQLPGSGVRRDRAADRLVCQRPGSRNVARAEGGPREHRDDERLLFPADLALAMERARTLERPNRL